MGEWMTPLEAGRVLRERAPAIKWMLSQGILLGDRRTGLINRRQVEAFAAARHERRARERAARPPNYLEKNQASDGGGDRAPDK
jgi:hypothetical protein